LLGFPRAGSNPAADDILELPAISSYY